MKLTRQLSPWSTGEMISQAYYASNTFSAATDVDRLTVRTPDEFRLDISGITLDKLSSTTISLANDASWDWGQSIGTWQAGHAYSVGDFIRPTSIADGANNTSTTYATPLMSANTHITGVVSSATNEYGTYYAWKGFNQATTPASEGWNSLNNSSFPYYLQIKFPTARVINKFRYNGQTGYSPKTFTFDGSNDGTNWTTLYTGTNVADPGNGSWTSYFTFSNTTAYLYYRINITVGWGITEVVIRELHLVAQPKLVYKCTTAGTSGLSEPSWGTTVGGTTTDSGATWTAYYDDTWNINRAGVDYYIYACTPVSGNTAKIILSRNSTYPHGYSSTTSRKIGGFHTLCNSINIPVTTWTTSTAYVIGDIVTPSTPNGYWYRCVASHTASSEPSWTTTIDATNYHTGTTVGWICEQIHPLQGYLTGDVLPYSVWDLNHRADCLANEGLVYDPKIRKWVGIYFVSGSSSVPVIVNGGTILNTITWFVANDAAKVLKMRLPKDYEFQSFAQGSNEMTNIYGSADPGTVGGYIDARLRRMVSYIGVEGCAGQMYQWIDESSYRFDAAASHTHACNATGSSETITSTGTTGPIATLSGTPTNGGTGYAANDTFYITLGDGTARGTVAAVTGGVVTSVTLNSSYKGTTGYSVNSGVPTTNIVGTGVGLTVNITAITATDLAPAWAYQAQTGGKGSLYTQGTYGIVKLRAGGHWVDGANCGSRSRYAKYFPWYTLAEVGFRAVCGHIRRCM